MHTFICACLCARLYVCLCVHTSIYVHVRVWVCTDTRVCLHWHVRACMLVCVDAYVTIVRGLFRFFWKPSEVDVGDMFETVLLRAAINIY